MDEVIMHIYQQIKRFLQGGNNGKLEYHEIYPIYIYHCIVAIELIQQISNDSIG